MDNIKKWWRKKPNEFSRKEIIQLAGDKYHLLLKGKYDELRRLPDYGYSPRSVDDLIRIMITDFDSQMSFNALIALKQISKKKGNIFNEGHFRKLFLMCNILQETHDYRYKYLLMDVGKMYPALCLEVVNLYVCDPEIRVSRKILSIDCLIHCSLENGLKRILSIFIDNWFALETNKDFVGKIGSLIKSHGLQENIKSLERAMMKTIDDNISDKKYDERYSGEFDEICDKMNIPLGKNHPLVRKCPHCNFQQGFLECLKERKLLKWKLAELLEKEYEDENLDVELRLYSFDHYISLDCFVEAGHIMINKSTNIILKTTYQKEKWMVKRRLLMEIGKLHEASIFAKGGLFSFPRGYSKEKKSWRRRKETFDGNESKFKVTAYLDNKSYFCQVGRYLLDGEKEFHFNGATSSFLSDAFGRPFVDISSQSRLLAFSFSRYTCFLVPLNKNEDSDKELKVGYDLRLGCYFSSDERLLKLFNHSLLQLLDIGGSTYLCFADDVLYHIHLVDLKIEQISNSWKFYGHEKAGKMFRKKEFIGHTWEVCGVQYCENLDLLVSCDGNEIIIFCFETEKILYRMYGVPLCRRIVVEGDSLFYRIRSLAVKTNTLPKNIRSMNLKQKKIHFARNSEVCHEHVPLKEYSFRMIDFCVSKNYVCALGNESNRKEAGNIRNINCVKVFSRERSMELLDVIYCSHSYVVPKDGDEDDEGVFHRVYCWKNFLVVGIWKTIKFYDLHAPEGKKKLIREWILDEENSMLEKQFMDRGIMFLKIVKRKKGELLIYAATLVRLFRLIFRFKKLCRFCRKGRSNMKCCSGCSVTLYCSRKCQSKDWKRHKSNCMKKST